MKLYDVMERLPIEDDEDVIFYTSKGHKCCGRNRGKYFEDLLNTDFDGCGEHYNIDQVVKWMYIPNLEEVETLLTK